MRTPHATREDVVRLVEATLPFLRWRQGTGEHPPYFDALKTALEPFVDSAGQLRIGSSGLSPLEVAQFWLQVEGDFTRHADACWIWRGHVNNTGYGHVSLGGRGALKRLAHRVAYELVKGPIPNGLLVCHACDEPLCVNPQHLWLGTDADNQQDAARKGRKRSLRGSAHPNHKLTDDDVRRLRAMVEGGVPLTRIGQHFGIHATTVARIARREKWAHVEGEAVLRDCKTCRGTNKVLPEGQVEYDEFDRRTWDPCPNLDCIDGRVIAVPLSWQSNIAEPAI